MGQVSRVSPFRLSSEALLLHERITVLPIVRAGRETAHANSAAWSVVDSGSRRGRLVKAMEGNTVEVQPVAKPDAAAERLNVSRIRECPEEVPDGVFIVKRGFRRTRARRRARSKGEVM